MDIEEIPRAFRYNCDGCPVYHKQENANGHYPNSTPPRWNTIKVTSATSSESFERLFCEDCSVIVRHIKDWKGKK